MGVSLVLGISMLRQGGIHGNDFKHLWAGAFLLDHGLSPYQPDQLFRVAASQRWAAMNPYVYLPTTGLLMRPLAWMRYHTAQEVWFWLNWGLAWAVVLGGPGLLRMRRADLARLVGAVFVTAAFPFYRQMTAGQMNVVMAALLILAAAALRRRREPAFGLILALGFAWKISPALLIVLAALMGRWRAALWGLGFSAAFILLSLVCFGWPVHREALSMIAEMGYGRSTWEALGNDFYRDPFNQSPNALLHHLLTENPYSRPWLALGPVFANGLTWLVSLGLFAACLLAARGRRLDRVRPAPRDPPRASDADVSLFLAGTLLMLLAPSLLWDHYCVQALPALMWLFGQGLVTRGPTSTVAGLAIAILLTIPWLHQAPWWREGVGIPMMSLRLWPLICLYGWLLIESGRREKVKGAHDQSASDMPAIDE